MRPTIAVAAVILASAVAWWTRTPATVRHDRTHAVRHQDLPRASTSPTLPTEHARVHALDRIAPGSAR